MRPHDMACIRNDMRLYGVCLRQYLIGSMKYLGFFSTIISNKSIVLGVRSVS
jgi:hypothetical protein